jgi:hypothetical protein
MQHRSKQGETKARILDAVIAGKDTRKDLKEFFDGEITHKDLTFHLSKNNNGLRFEHVLHEKNGKISLNVNTVDIAARTMDYLIRLPKYRYAFDMAFTECFFSGYGESLHHISILAEQKEKGDVTTSLAPRMAVDIFNKGVRVPWAYDYRLDRDKAKIAREELRKDIAHLALEIFKEGRGMIDTKIQLCYIANVIGKALAAYDHKEINLRDGTTAFISINTMLRNATENNAWLQEAFSRIVDIANKKKNTILGKVTETEKALAKASYFVFGVYTWKAYRMGDVIPLIGKKLNLAEPPEDISQKDMEFFEDILGDATSMP